VPLAKLLEDVTSIHIAFNHIHKVFEIFGKDKNNKFMNEK